MGSDAKYKDMVVTGMADGSLYMWKDRKMIKSIPNAHKGAAIIGIYSTELHLVT